MQPSLTPAVAHALEVARFFALGAGSPQVEPVHVLHALLEEEEGRAATLAVSVGMDLAAYHAGRGERPREGTPFFPLSPGTNEVLALARSLAVELTGESTLSSEPLLLALLQAGTGLAAALEPVGLRLPVLEAFLHAHKPPAIQLEEPLQLAEVTERMDNARILDAGANRAREALRTVEDYCRFVLEDRFLSTELKELRHDLNQALDELAPDDMLSARETLRDVGTTISTESEQSRSSLFEVAKVNLKRLQEALRSLEEFGKFASPRLGERLEQMRYRAYTLERAVLMGAEARNQLQHVQLYVLLSGADCISSLEWTIEESAAGGTGMVQLREKTLPDRELLQRSRAVRRWTRKAGVLFIVNDRPDIARLVEADGVHLGQDDMPVKDARRILGANAIVGVSTHSIEQVRQAVLDGATYIGVGPTFPSETKQFDDFPGLAFVQAALAETSLPAFAIGGINVRTIAAVAAVGASRVAVSGAVARSDDPRAVSAALLQTLSSEAGRSIE